MSVFFSWKALNFIKQNAGVITILKLITYTNTLTIPNMMDVKIEILSATLYLKKNT